MPNVLIKDIRQSYRSLYHLCEQALAPLEKLTKRSIPSEEIGFTILFGGEFSGKNEQRQEKLKALIVCPSGISSSLILQSELRRLFPMIEFKETNAVREIENVSEKAMTSFSQRSLLKQPKGLSYQAHYELFGEKSIDAPSSIRLAIARYFHARC